MDKSKPETQEARDPSAHREVVRSDIATGKQLLSWLSVGVVGALFIFLALTSGQLFNRGIRAGDIAERNILAPQTAFVFDPVATKEAKENARQLVVPAFQMDRSRDELTLKEVDKSLDRIKLLQAKGLVPDIGKTVNLSLSADEDFYLLTCSTEAFENIFSQSVSQTSTSLDGIVSAKVKAALTKTIGRTRGRSARVRKRKAAELLAKLKTSFETKREIIDELVKVEDQISRSEALIALSVAPSRMSDYTATLNGVTKRILNRFERFAVSDKVVWADTVYEFLPDAFDSTLRRSSSEIISTFLEPNLVIDPAATKVKADQALRAVQPITRKYEKGQLIVKKGTVISEEIAETLQTLGFTRISSFPFLVVLGFTVIAAVAFAGLFLHQFEPKHFFSSTSLGLIYSVVVVACAVASVFGQTHPQFVPMSGAALCLVIFFGRNVALAVIIPLLILVAVDRLVGGVHLVAIAMACAAAIFGNSRDRKSLMFTGLLIGVAQAFGFLVAYGIGKSLPFLSLGKLLPVLGVGTTPWMVLAPHVSLPSVSDLGQVLALEFAGGLASAIVAIGCLPFLENIFGLVTPYRLAEMAEADQPLLQQLEEKAPGTYQHSLAVANLAEAAAKAIKVDVKLVRAGALYHDVGKLVRPKFFIENQLGAKNPHDLMSPEDSRDRVLAHVTDGIELAKKYAIPKAISDFIPMHQGTTLMAYFYHKACERDGKNNVDAQFFRYPGPKPNSKETAIVMLADAAEAVTHSMKDPTEADVEKAINKIFELRWADEQFSEADLSYDEMQRVKLAFVRVWRTLHHERLKYPSTATGKMDVDESENSSSKDESSSSSEEKKDKQDDQEKEVSVSADTDQDTTYSARGEGCS